MKLKTLILTSLFVAFSCSDNEIMPKVEVQQNDNDALSKKEINSIIKSKLETEGDFSWKNEDVHTIWSALHHGNNILTIGYGNSEKEFAKSKSSENTKNEILQLIRNNERNGALSKTKTSDDFYSDETINVIDIQVTRKSTIAKLLKDSKVRYIEPADYVYDEEKNGYARSAGKMGCGYTYHIISNSDFTIVSPASLVPWNFYKHNIPSAWNYSTGAGVTIGLIDTGLSPEQSLLNNDFNDGYSSGRYVQKYGSYVDSVWPWKRRTDGPNDKCGHGTGMASVAVAPRNDNYLPVGVAYNANLVSYRAVKNVVIDNYHEKRGVANALTALANRSDVKIISMSLGSVFTVNRVRDAIRYAYNRGKMIVSAGGTSTSFTSGVGVIFPANMWQTVAVTGVKEGQYNRCNECHSGSKIDFTVQMQRTNGTDNKVPVLSYYNGWGDYVGGSSVATATVAGIAALVWAKHPTWTRDQVLEKMRRSGDFYPYKHSQFGHGNINALQAVQ